MSTTHKTRWYWPPPWWVWAIASLLAAILALRLHGYARYQDLLAELRSLGLETNLAAMVLKRPEPDHDRQARLAVLLEERPWFEPPGSMPWSQKLQTNDVERWQAWLTTTIADSAELAALLREGPVAANWFGFLPRDAQWLQHAGLGELNKDRLNFQGSRSYALSISGLAWNSSDPTYHLDSLNLLEKAHQDPADLNDAMASLAVAGTRNNLCLALAVHGRLPIIAWQAWKQSQFNAETWITDAFSTERCVAQNSIGTNQLLWDVQQSAIKLAAWPVRGHSASAEVAFIAQQELSMRGLPSIGSRNKLLGMRLPTVMVMNTNEIFITAVEAQYARRIHVIAAGILLYLQAGNSLPANLAKLQTAIPSLQLDSLSVNNPAVTYEGLGPTRFRVGLDPSVPIPAFHATRRPETAIGMPAQRGFQIIKRWSVEIDSEGHEEAPAEF